MRLLRDLQAIAEDLRDDRWHAILGVLLIVIILILGLAALNRG